jgi:FMN-dependent NADH-azoreductase
VLLTSRGEFGFAPGGMRASWNHLDPHVRTCARFLGVEHVHHIAIEYQEFGDARHDASVAAALSDAADVAQRLAA